MDGQYLIQMILYFTDASYINASHVVNLQPNYDINFQYGSKIVGNPVYTEVNNQSPPNFEKLDLRELFILIRKIQRQDGIT